MSYLIRPSLLNPTACQPIEEVLKRSATLSTLALFLAMTSGVAAYGATNHNGVLVDMVRPGGDRQCTLFSLVGVGQSDPIVPGSIWFSIPETAPAYKEMVATLLLAKATSKPVDVSTTGAVPSACGHPGVAVLVLH